MIDREQIARLGQHVEASRPEPPPVPLGDEVTPVLLRWLSTAPLCVRVLVQERDAYGRGKYGQGLRTQDGRDGVEDLRQELGDALQYAAKVAMVGGRDAELLELLEAVYALRDMLLWPETVRVSAEALHP